MDGSILNDIKRLLNVDPEHCVFDNDIIIAINSAFMVLNQLGVGPKSPYYISSSEELWSDFTSKFLDIQAVKTYVYLRTRLLFDPPTSGVLTDAIDRQLAEYEWRLLVQSEGVDFSTDQFPELPVVGGDHKTFKEGE